MREKIIFIILIFICLASIGCVNKKENRKDFSKKKVVYDDIQKIIADNYYKKETESPIFIVYETIWQVEDNFYIRKLIYSFSEQINQDLESESAMTLPMSVVIDKEKNTIIRHVAFSEEFFDQEAMFNEFPKEVYDKVLNMDNQEVADKIDQLHEEIIILAKKYYEIDKSEDE